ncbi:hypothetical protein GJ744_003828 [Endocarpon pusillum]|uniref:Uncharacterized protein n=1 Tax=Endocarpon pusillum TaxID=364733 RepID=A0A8H7AM16_9EURO|nr:hypothetical protein GJ744_003828 [Endocarpon pusillum]
MKVPSRIGYETARGRLCRIRSAPLIFCHDRVEAILGSSPPGTRAVQNLRHGQHMTEYGFTWPQEVFGKLEALISGQIS